MLFIVATYFNKKVAITFIFYTVMAFLRQEHPLYFLYKQWDSYVFMGFEKELRELRWPY
jgi:hypothetical protein